MPRATPCETPGHPDVVEGLLELAPVIKAGGDVSAVSPAVEQITGTRARSFEQFASDHLELFRAEPRAA
jgi:hypothetical protein